MYIGVQLNIFMPAQTAGITALHEQIKQFMSILFYRQICKSGRAKFTTILKFFV